MTLRIRHTQMIMLRKLTLAILERFVIWTESLLILHKFLPLEIHVLSLDIYVRRHVPPFQALRDVLRQHCTHTTDDTRLHRSPSQHIERVGRGNRSAWTPKDVPLRQRFVLQLLRRIQLRCAEVFDEFRLYAWIVVQTDTLRSVHVVFQTRSIKGA